MNTAGSPSSSPPPPPPSAAAAASASSTSDNAVPSASAAAASGCSSSNAMTIDQHLAQTIHTIEQLTTIFNFPNHLAREAVEECGPEDVTRCYNWILDHHDVEDGGGPVVPKVDCPHVAKHVKFRIIDSNSNDSNGGLMKSPTYMMKIGDENGSVSQLAEEFLKLCLEGNLMTSDCQHNQNNGSMRKRASRKRLRSEEENAVGMPKCEEDYEDAKEGGMCSKSPACPEGENWLCLECGALMCSRYANGHAKMHYEDTKEEEQEIISLSAADNVEKSSPEVIIEVEGGDQEPVRGAEGHCIAVSLADLSVWCYECNAYLHNPALEALTKHLEELKFGKDAEKGCDGGIAHYEANKNETDRERTTDAMEHDSSDNAGDAANNGGIESSEQKATSSINKRKGQPRKLPPEELGTTVFSTTQQRQGSKEANSNNDQTNHLECSDSSSSDEEGDSRRQADVIASLLQSEHGEALRAYLSRYESFDTSNMGQCVPMHMPKPPSFPDEMADFLRSPLCKSVLVLAGAGMSVSSGIPDFRSAGVGLYDTLRPELLTASELEQALIEDDPTLALDKGMFLQNPLPMLETKRSFILGTYEKKWKATLAHRFVEMLHTKLGKLTRLYTQNIDGLELQTRLPREKVVNVHGSMGAAACERCGQAMDFDKFCNEVKSNIKDITGQDADAPSQSTPIICEACDNPTVKPTIVLFRASMPEEFHTRTAQDLPDCDLLIIMGTSLTVAPANSLVYRIPPTALRMVINNERVGRQLGIDYSEENSVRDVWAHGHTDETCLNLAEKMGWLDDLALVVDELPDSSAELLRARLAQRQGKEDDLEEEED